MVKVQVSFNIVTHLRTEVVAIIFHSLVQSATIYNMLQQRYLLNRRITKLGRENIAEEAQSLALGRELVRDISAD